MKPQVKSPRILCRNFYSGNHFIQTLLNPLVRISLSSYNAPVYEAYLPTLTQKATQKTRLSSPFKNGGWPAGPSKKEKERPETSRPGLIEGRHLSLRASPSKRSGDRRILISRRLVPLATQRNWWRRRIREVFRKNESFFVPNVALRIKLHSCGQTRPKFSELEKEIVGLLRSSQLIK